MAVIEVVHRTELRGAGRELMRRRDGEVLLSGPAGTGKSRACLEKLNLLALKYPGMRGLIVRKTATSLTSTGLVTYEEQVIPELLANQGVTWFGGSARAPAMYRYSNRSKLVVGGMDNPTKIMSSDYDVVYVQEAIELTEDDWEKCTTRLRNGKVPYQQLIADTNPSKATHWLKARCDVGRTTMLHSRHEDNPYLFDLSGRPTEAGNTYVARLDALTGARLQRLRYGRWASAEGVVYEDWDDAVHLVDRFDVPEAWSRWWTVDFGYTNPFVLQRWAEDPDGRLYLYAETYRTGLLVEDAARAVLAEVTDATGRWLEPRPRAVICDHDAEDRATLTRHLGLGTTAARKTVTDGIQATQARLRAAGDGKPRLFVLRDARTHPADEALLDAKRPTCTAEEPGGYVWDTRDGRPPKEVPVKENDHGLDAARYLVAHRDLGSRPRIGWL